MSEELQWLYRTQGYDANDYGEVSNGPGTFTQLRRDLAAGPVMISWVDGEGTCLAILFARPKRVGSGGGLDRGDKLIVAIVGHGCYGFSSPTVYPYVAEKLKVSGTVTNQRLSILINAALGMDPKIE